jgi:hypothetical protein
MLTTNEESPVDLVTSKDELVSQAPTPIVFQCKVRKKVISKIFFINFFFFRIAV